jgi:hypothetical protein
VGTKRCELGCRVFKTRLLLDVLWRKRLTGRLNQKWTKYAKLEQGTRGDQGARGVEGTGPDEETNALAHGAGRGILQVKRNVTSPKRQMRALTGSWWLLG